MFWEKEFDPGKATLRLIAVTTVLRLAIAGLTGLGIGESYYFRGALQPHLSYFDQPPLFFWLSNLSLKLFGLNNPAIRLPAVILFAGTTGLLYLVGKRLYNPRAGFFAALLLNLSFIFTLSVGAWFQPDAPLMFFWMATVYFVVRAVFPEEESKYTWLWWLPAGLSLGLAMLSKYHSVFLALGILIFLLVNKDYRHKLLHPGPYIAVLIACLCFLPVLIWNMDNGYVSFIFQGSRAGGNPFNIHIWWLIRNILGQMAFITPWIWFPILGAFFGLLKKENSSPASSFIFWLAALPVLFFTTITLWTDTTHHFHWQAPGYLMLFLPLGKITADRLSGEAKMALRTAKWLKTSAIVILVLIVVGELYVMTGFCKFLEPRWLADKFANQTDPTMEGYDYDALKTRFEKEGWLDDKNLFVVSTSWIHVGKIDWALKARKDVLLFSNDTRNYAFFFDAKDYLGKDAVVVSKDPFDGFAPFFDSLKEVESAQIKRGGITELTFHVYYGHCFRLPKKIPGPLKDETFVRQIEGKSPFPQ